jgi:hypothetical protein
MPSAAADDTPKKVVEPWFSAVRSWWRNARLFKTGAFVLCVTRQPGNRLSRRNPATRGERKGTLIRHATLCSAPSIITLAIAMVVATRGSQLVPTVGLSSLVLTGSPPTHFAAVVVSLVTVAADEEDPVTVAGTTNSLTENNFDTDRRHLRLQARLDNGHRSMAG